jgi:short-subunit dehydrogenase
MKVAIITGAASGIGLALSRIYLEKNTRVVMVDKNQSALQEQSETLLQQFPKQVIAMACDVTQEEAVIHLAQVLPESLGRIDYLVNNAGIMGDLAPIWDLKVQSLHQLFEVNLFGMIHMIQAFSPVLFRQNFNSHLVNIASLYALCSTSQMAAYAMSKHAVLALSESLYFDLKRLNKPVNVSIVFPSFTNTSLLNQRVPLTTNAALHESLKSLLTHSKSPLEVAKHIVQEVDKKQFYILPDREVKTYCEERIQAILMQDNPHNHSIEKLMNSLIKRSL